MRTLRPFRHTRCAKFCPPSLPAPSMSAAVVTSQHPPGLPRGLVVTPHVAVGHEVDRTTLQIVDGGSQLGVVGASQNSPGPMDEFSFLELGLHARLGGERLAVTQPNALPAKLAKHVFLRASGMTLEHHALS